MKFTFIFKTSVITLFFLILPSLAFTQENFLVVGKVTDGHTGAPISNAKIYLANTFIYTTTDAAGEYQLPFVEPGTYTLIVDYSGYVYQRRQLRFEVDSEFTVESKLTKKRAEFLEFVVDGKQPQGWKKNLKMFTESFLGTSEFAKDSKIVNPFVLGFVNDKKQKYFKAAAKDMIVIENNAFGYLVHYTLRDFSINRGQLKYWGELYFEEMTPPNDKEQQKWQNNREKAFLGSRRHFLISLINSSVTEEGFEVKYINILPPTNSPSYDVDDIESLSRKVKDNQYEINFKNYLSVKYLPGRNVKMNRTSYSEYFEGVDSNYFLKEEKYPVTHLRVKSNPIYFDESGYIFDREKLLQYGSWPYYGIAEFLPREYRHGGK